MAKVDPVAQSQFAKISADPEWQRLYAQVVAAQKSGVTDYPAYQRLTDQLAARRDALGGLPKGYTYGGETPSLAKETSTAGALGKALLYTGLGVGASYALPALAGGAGAAGAGTSAATSTAAGAGSGAAATGATAAGSGILGTLAKVAPYAGPALSSMAQGRAAGRVAELDAMHGRDQLEIQRYMALLSMLNTQNNDRAFNANMAAHGGLLEGAEDVNIQAPAGIPVGQVTGGLRPSAIKGRSDLGAELRRDAMLKLLNPKDRVPSPPELSEVPDASWIDTALGAGGLAMNGLNLYNDIRKPAPSTGVVNPRIVRNAGVTFR